MEPTAWSASPSQNPEMFLSRLTTKLIAARSLSFESVNDRQTARTRVRCPCRTSLKAKARGLATLGAWYELGSGVDTHKGVKTLTQLLGGRTRGDESGMTRPIGVMARGERPNEENGAVDIPPGTLWYPPSACSQDEPGQYIRFHAAPVSSRHQQDVLVERRVEDRILIARFPGWRRQLV